MMREKTDKPADWGVGIGEEREKGRPIFFFSFRIFCGIYFFCFFVVVVGELCLTRGSRWSGNLIDCFISHICRVAICSFSRTFNEWNSYILFLFVMDNLYWCKLEWNNFIIRILNRDTRRTLNIASTIFFFIFLDLETLFDHPELLPKAKNVVKVFILYFLTNIYTTHDDELELVELETVLTKKSLDDNDDLVAPRQVKRILLNLQDSTSTVLGTWSTLLIL